MAHISQLYIYPVKSLGAISLQQSEVTSRGLRYDRRWMLIDEKNRFLSQRKYPQMSLFHLILQENGIKVTYQPTGQHIIIPYKPQTNTVVEVDVWDSLCTGNYVSEEVDEWFSTLLNITCRLIYMTDDSLRQVDERYAGPGHITSFSDGYPILLISEASLADLNTRLTHPVSINRFRPNIVIKGTEAYLEDCLQHFEAGGISFYGVKPCARCVMIGVDPLTANTGAEPLKTLASYRKVNNKIYFGQNLIHKGEGTISIGDELNIKQLGDAAIVKVVSVQV
ncbi:MOSC domain-containing protein [Mucilaginibacter terrae]|uniref:MOSC domain-containing protein n=1 Tax=Mucilaginibacter terrae TaxID=1955052 RepID=UPI00362CFFAE